MLQDYDDDGFPIVETIETPESKTPEFESSITPSYTMQPVWYLLVLIAIVGIYVIRRRRSQQGSDKELDA